MPPRDPEAGQSRDICNRHAPTLTQVEAMVAAMPIDTILQRRDRAMLCLMILTGARDGAVGSLRLKHLNLVERRLV
jgi:site-specific recombinase XerC